MGGRSRALFAVGLVVALGAVVPACARPAAPPTQASPPPDDRRDDAAIERAEEAYLDWLVEAHPEQATALGLHARDAHLDDRSMPGWEARLRQEEAMLNDLRARFAAPVASRAARTDLTILEHTLLVDLRWQRARRPLETQPDSYVAPLEALFTMMARDYAPARDRARAVLSRLRELPATVAAAKANLGRPPEVWTEVGIERAGGARAFFADLRPQLLAALAEEPHGEADVDGALRVATAAYEEYRAFLEREVLPRSSGQYALGREMFELMVHENDFLTEDAPALRALGQRVFTETEREMTALARAIDPAARSWPEVTAKIKAKHPTASELIPSYAREVERARRFLLERDAVPFPEGDACEVIETPPFQRATTSAAYDEAPPFDADPHGFFFVTPVDPAASPDAKEQMLRENDHGDQVDTAVHEAYPGHHLQLSFARRHPSRIRKATGPDIFEEGWAFYAEELMSELGYYSPEERMMQLEWTLVRAARVLIDVGLHTEGMTVDQAVAMLTDQVHLERELAVSEVKRYTLEPTQPLAYVAGREKLLELRRRYKEREGARFTLKGFHAEVLSHGSIAPALLGEEMFGL